MSRTASVLPADLDFLVARLHGQRGRLAEAERLDVLCRIRTIPELVRAVCPEASFSTVGQLHQWLIQRAVRELFDFSQQLTGAGSRLMAWMRVRFQVENLKVLARAFATGRSLDLARQYLVSLPEDLSLDIEALAAADSVESLAAAVPSEILSQGLAEAAATYEEEPRPIVLEAALDRAYLRELIRRSKALPLEARRDSTAISKQEADTFHLMLVVRGRFTYGLPAERLAEFHVSGAGISRNRFCQMLDAGNLRDAAKECVGLVLRELPTEHTVRGEGPQDPDPAVLETLAWNRYLRLASRGFRRSHMGLGAVVAYAAIRRIELANLITLSEGIRTEMAPDVIRSRLVPTSMEAVRV